MHYIKFCGTLCGGGAAPRLSSRAVCASAGSGSQYAELAAVLADEEDVVRTVCGFD